MALTSSFDMLFVRAALTARRALVFLGFGRIASVLVALLARLDMLLMRAALGSGGLRLAFCFVGRGRARHVLVALLASAHMIFVRAVCDRILGHWSSPWYLVNGDRLAARQLEEPIKSASVPAVVTFSPLGDVAIGSLSAYQSCRKQTRGVV